MAFQNENQNIRTVHKRLSKDLRAHAAKKNQSITCPGKISTQEKPLNVINLGQGIFDHINQMITITAYFIYYSIIIGTTI